MPGRIFGITDRKVVLSMLWVFVVFNYLYADIVILIFRPGAYEAMAARMPAVAALGATIVMEFLLAMALLSRVLAYPVNRWVNIIAGIVGTLFVGVTLAPQSPPAYLELAGIEIASTIFVVCYAWTWPRPRSALSGTPDAA